MSEPEAGSENAIQVCVRVRPLNNRERDEGNRTCVQLDDETKQVVLTAVDKNTLLQLRGQGAKGYAFDKRYNQNDISDNIYDDVVGQLVEKVFKGYNGTVLAYGQTGSGKTHTMSGGVGFHGKMEEGITPRVIRHVFALVEALRKRAKLGEKVEVNACALELYNEDLLDLCVRGGSSQAAGGGWDGARASSGLKLQERPVGKEGRVVPEVVGLTELKCETADDLSKFYSDCMENRSTSSTKLNDRSSRSHAIFTITVSRTMVDVLNEVGEDMRARVRTTEFVSKLHLVDLAGSERVKRSGVTGKELKEASHINGGLLALGNVIVALSGEGDGKKKGHVPYRDSKLTRMLQDSLGGNSLTVLISCISPSEMDFEETNNTLKYANRACHIKNTPLPNKYTTLEEDLLPALPSAAGGMGMFQLQSLLEDHERLKETREARAKEKADKEAKKQAALQAMKDEMVKKPGFQRLRASQYDELRRQLASKGNSIPTNQVIGDETIKGFGRSRLSQSVEGLEPVGTPGGSGMAGAGAAGGSGRRSSAQRRSLTSGRRSAAVPSSKASAAKAAGGNSFQDWLTAQVGDDASAGTPGSQCSGTEDFSDGYDQEGGTDHEGHSEGHDPEVHSEDQSDFIQEDDEEGENFIEEDEDAAEGAGAHGGVVEEEAEGAGGAVAAAAATVAVDEAAGGKSKFRRARAAFHLDPTPAHAAGPDASASDALPLDADAEADADARPSVIKESGSMQSLEAGAAGSDVGTSVLAEEEPEVFDPIQDNAMPKLLARFRVNRDDVLAVFKALSKEDFQDVVGLLPQGTPLPASDKMTYLLARLETGSGTSNIDAALQRVAAGEASMTEAVGPAVGCLMATFGTNMISTCIFEFQDPEDLTYYGVEERIELWGLQIPHNSVRPQLAVEEDAAAEPQEPKEKDVITWTSVDRLNMSIGLLFALCNHAMDQGIRCGFCVPRPQLLKRWLQAGVRMKQITTSLKLIYPSSAHDYEYYKASTVAYFMIEDVKEALSKVLAVVE